MSAYDIAATTVAKNKEIIEGLEMVQSLIDGEGSDICYVQGTAIVGQSLVIQENLDILNSAVNKIGSVVISQMINVLQNQMKVLCNDAQAEAEAILKEVNSYEI